MSDLEDNEIDSADTKSRVAEKQYKYKLKVLDGFDSIVRSFLSKNEKIFSAYDFVDGCYIISFNKLSDIENFYNLLIQAVEVVEFEEVGVDSQGENIWYAVSVSSGRELSVLDALNDHKNSVADSMIDDVFAPVSYSKSWGNDNVAKMVKACMTPGYVFVKTSHPNHIINAVKKLGVMASFFKPVKNKEIERLMKKDGCNYDQKHSYSVGDQVCVCSGPFANHKGIIEEITGQGDEKHLKLMISVFGRKLSVKVGLSEIRRGD